ncbi:LSD1-like2 [Hibiscus syriacus]|uniref:LSD1-like2 n=1 Tax=Hibiscus syriacus TaxID=106335 RepID=A0A6A3C3I0_HIBSY|nr:LSD1-like2 [Hibiscus syriacus]
MFTEEELKDMEGLKRESDFIEVKCGCTSKKYGDTIGKLRVFTNGQFLISCQCTPVCDEGRNQEMEEPHLGDDERQEGSFMEDLLKYYKHASNGDNELTSLRAKRLFHRDEFIRCTKCKKQRRFRLRTDEECQSPAKLMKNEQAGRVAGAALDHLLAKVALPVSVSGATSADFSIASVALASISSKMPSLEAIAKALSILDPYASLFHHFPNWKLFQCL